MKKRFLPFGLSSLLIFSLAGIFIFSSGTADKEISPVKKGAQSIAGGKAYLASLRNNQNTGVLDPKDVILANQEFDQQANLKSAKSKAYTWDELGPNNMGGRTRALIFDNRDESANTIFAGSVTGGLFKSINTGSTWSKVNLNSGTACLNVTSMVQSSDGTIYVGTGEGLGAENYSAYGELGFEGGFVGKGIFKSNSNDNFNLVPGTSPNIQGASSEWAYINDLAIDKSNNKLYAATHTGLKYASLPALDNWSTVVKHKLDSIIVNRVIALDSTVSCDSFDIVDGAYVLYGSSGWDIEIVSNDTTNEQSVFSEFVNFETQGNCYDVKVSDNGELYTILNNQIYVSESGDPKKFITRSIYPDNFDNVRMDNIDYNSNVVISDKSGNILHEASSSATQVYDWHTDYKDFSDPRITNYPPSADAGRTEIAIAPSDQNVVYAMVSKGINPNRNSLLGIYLTEDKGQTWRNIAPGGSEALNILGSSYGTGNTPYYQGDYNNTLIVFPNNPYRIFAGGIDMWLGEKTNETGYYNWSAKSSSDAPSVGGIFSPLYCHMDHHVYVFKPTNTNHVFIGTDGGVYLGKISGSNVSYQSINKNYNVSQFYSLDISSRPNEFVGGAQDIGTIYVAGRANTGLSGEDLWREASFPSAFPEGTDGGSAAYTTLGYKNAAGEQVASPIYYSRGPRPQNGTLIDRMRRSETLGFDYSLDFLSSDITDDRFITPMTLWESYDNQNSQIYVTWFADKNYDAGDPILVRSNVYDYPFTHVLEDAISNGDSLEVKDIISNKLFIGIEDELYMSLNSTDFAAIPEWFLISDKNHNGIDGEVQCIAFSSDANYVWVGTNEGLVYRISNVAHAFDQNTADVSSANCIIAATEVTLPGNITQVVTSIAVDPKDANKVLVTLGNYGNEKYVFYSSNGKADVPTFAGKQGNLPKVPVYSSILEMDAGTNKALLGTEFGVWASDNVANGVWYFASQEIGRVPVMAMKQRTFYKPKFTITYVDPSTGQSTYDVYPAMENYRDIFVATHGRGVFKFDQNSVNVDENPFNPVSNELNINMYPNPAATFVNIDLELPSRQNITLNVFDFTGKLVLTDKTGNLPSGKQSHELNINSLKEGTYLLQCIAGNSISTKKFVVVK